MNLRFIDWIWHIRGSLVLASEQSRNDIFSKLDPLFHQNGTRHELTDDTLMFWKKDQAAQDKMSIFDDGVLHLEKGVAGYVLRYRLTSRALLFCFLAPLLFLGIAQLTIAIGKLEKSPTQIEKKLEASTKAAKLAAKKPDLPMNPLDKFLGAPTPEKPGKSIDKSEGRDKKPSPTPAYVFAAIFAALYVAGRILEDRLVRALFKKNLLGT